MHGRSATQATLTVCGLFFAGLLAGAWAGSAAAARAQDPYAQLDLFARVLTTIETDYVDEIPTSVLVDAAIRGMVEELDRHSRWMSRDEYATLHDETTGRYEGIGVEVMPASDADGLRIEKVLPGSPAVRDGLRPGDRILAVDGEPVVDLDMDAVSELLKGPRGATVVLTVAREAEDDPVEVRTIRDTVRIPVVEAGFVAERVGYVRLIQFPNGAANDLGAAIDTLRQRSQLDALVLDLRDNPGGLLDEAIAVTDLFLDEGTIVSTRGRLEGEVVHAATPGGYPDLPLVLLVNGQSASASEIVAGALQDTGRATLVGTHTFGKGSVQTVYEHRDHSALKLTIGAYYTPSGEPVAANDGRRPDVEIELPAAKTAIDALRERIDALEVDDAARAELFELVDALNYGDPEPAELPWDQPLPERPGADPQLARAIELALEGR